MKITNKLDLVIGLWDDWENHKEDRKKSLIYRYFEDKKNMAASKLNPGDIKEFLNADEGRRKELNKKYGKYVLLKGSGYLFKAGMISERDYREVRELINETEEKVLKGLVGDYFRNEGKKSEKAADNDDRKAERVSYFEKKDASYIDLIELENFFLENSGHEKENGNGQSSSGIAGNMNSGDEDEPLYIKECESLYAKMNKNVRYEECLVPLKMDIRTGTMVMIMGRKCFYMGELLERICYPVVLEWYESQPPLMDDEDYYRLIRINEINAPQRMLKSGTPNNPREEIKRGQWKEWNNENIFGSGHTYFNLGMLPAVFESISDAFMYFSKRFSEEDVTFFPDNNSQPLPEGAPRRFEKYFAGASESDNEIIKDYEGTESAAVDNMIRGSRRKTGNSIFRR